MPKTVIALMDGLPEAQAAVKELTASGIAREGIGFMANQKHALPDSALLNEAEGGDASCEAPAGARIGAVAGGLIGELVGELTHRGVPEEKAHCYAEGLRRGGILVTAAAESTEQAHTAATAMKRHGAVDIDERATEWKKQGWKGRFGAAARR